MDGVKNPETSRSDARGAHAAGVPDILERILHRKREEIAEKKARVPAAAISARAGDAPPPRPFAGALRARMEAGGDAVIAEIKRASPSKGLLREDFEAAEIAASYEHGGAAALSVLTDRDFFQGADEYIALVKDACRLPVLRKEFIVDPWQIHESRALGADGVLLIAAALETGPMHELAALALDLAMDVLVEVHDASELARVPPLDGLVLGVNNRDLRTFETRLDTTIALLERVPSGALLVTESGIHGVADVDLMRRHGVRAFLVGEAFMRAPDPGAELARLFAPSPGAATAPRLPTEGVSGRQSKRRG